MISGLLELLPMVGYPPIEPKINGIAQIASKPAAVTRIIIKFKSSN